MVDTTCGSGDESGHGCQIRLVAEVGKSGRATPKTADGQKPYSVCVFGYIGKGSSIATAIGGGGGGNLNGVKKCWAAATAKAEGARGGNGGS